MQVGWCHAGNANFSATLVRLNLRHAHGALCGAGEESSSTVKADCEALRPLTSKPLTIRTGQRDSNEAEGEATSHSRSMRRPRTLSHSPGSRRCPCR